MLNTLTSYHHPSFSKPVSRCKVDLTENVIAIIGKNNYTALRWCSVFAEYHASYTTASVATELGDGVQSITVYGNGIVTPVLPECPQGRRPRYQLSVGDTPLEYLMLGSIANELGASTHAIPPGACRVIRHEQLSSIPSSKIDKPWLASNLNFRVKITLALSWQRPRGLPRKTIASFFQCVLSVERRRPFLVTVGEGISTHNLLHIAIRSTAHVPHLLSNNLPLDHQHQLQCHYLPP